MSNGTMLHNGDKMERRKIVVLGIAIAVIVCALTFPVHAAEPTTSVHIIKYASDGATILNETAVTYEWMKTNLPIQGDGITEFYLQGPVFDWPPGPWDPDETTNFKDKGAVKGTNVKDLCDLVGGMSPGDEIKVSASDGFSKWFNYTNVYEPQPRQGPIVLCWYKDGNYVPDYEEGMQIVFFADNSTNSEHKHVFGNWDMHECLAEKYWHNFSAVYPSTNGLSVKYVDEIAIYSNETTWNLELTGAINETMSKAAFEEGVVCHGVSYTDYKNRTWEGIPLWYLMGRVDDTVTHGSGAFNDTLADAGYDVTVIAGDGYSKTFNSTYLARNDSYIVACYLNGSELPEFDAKGKPLAPLKLVGPYLSGGQKVGNIVKIALDIAPAPSEGNLTLTGNETKVYTLDEIKAMPSYTAGGGFKKSSGAIVGPFTYKGVNITYLTGLVGGLTPSNSVKVTASDGYSMTYTYDQIMGDITTYNATTGEPEPDGHVTMVLAYEEGENPIPNEYGGPLRIAFVGPDSPITDGHFWIKWVNKIEILGGVEEWNLTLRGAITEVMDRSTFESGVGCHGASWTDDKNRTWKGMPLWYLVGWVDDAVKHDFNDTLADKGYNVTVIASDGYSKTFNSTFVKRNDNIILANELNGTALPEKYWPLRLVGPDLKKSEMVRNVVELRIPELMPHAFDTREPENAYPSIFGTHNGTIEPSATITVQKLFTYACPGTGGHAEYVKIWNSTGWNATAHWDGYEGDWHNVTFDEAFTLKAGETYNYTIRTGSYPQIIHAREFNATGGTITCTEFTDANGKIYDNWIPAIRLE